MKYRMCQLARKALAHMCDVGRHNQSNDRGQRWKLNKAARKRQDANEKGEPWCGTRAEREPPIVDSGSYYCRDGHCCN